MEVNRKKIVKEFLENIHRISSKEYQKKIWIDGAGPECHDFDEAVNDFFDDSELILQSYQSYGLSQNQYRLLTKFHKKFKMFADNHDLPEEFIDTPEWERIMSLAKEVLQAFKD